MNFIEKLKADIQSWVEEAAHLNLKLQTGKYHNATEINNRLKRLRIKIAEAELFLSEGATEGVDKEGK